MKNNILSIAALCFVSSVLAGKLVVGHQSGEAVHKFSPDNQKDALPAFLPNPEVEAANIFANKIIEGIGFVDMASISSALSSDAFTVEQIRGIVLASAFKVFQDILKKEKENMKSDLELPQTRFGIIQSFLKARTDLTKTMDDYFVSIWNTYRQLPFNLLVSSYKTIVQKFKQKAATEIPPTLIGDQRKQVIKAINEF